ncbi:DUF6199 family natural product biosynthesis protein [Mycobacterium sp. NPDC050441]|uniref:DUF6199 family natural product biosynthesis protein n=1 Tax=Mycobacterium sp. NPDC050441 TaxID=3155403 RepID=UPI0033DDB37C
MRRPAIRRYYCWPVGAGIFLIIVGVLVGGVMAAAPRRIWWATQSWKFRHPEANEPSDTAYGMTQAGGALFRPHPAASTRVRNSWRCRLSSRRASRSTTGFRRAARLGAVRWFPWCPAWALPL